MESPKAPNLGLFTRYGNECGGGNAPWHCTHCQVECLVRDAVSANTSSGFTRAALAEKSFWEKPQSRRIVAAQSESGAMPKRIAPYACWIEAQISQGDYASTSDYVRDLVRRDRAHREEELTLDALRQKLSASRDSGEGSRSVDDIFAEAKALARARGLLRE